MDLELKGLRAVVTGGTKGIGRGIADTLAAEGADVSICARNGAEVAAAVEALQAQGVRAMGKALDVSDAGALKAWVDETAAAFGGIDIVVANVSALALDNDEAAWKIGFDVDLMGTVRLVDAALPYLEQSKLPSIVTIASISARDIDFTAGPYGALKAAIVHYTQGLAYRLGAKRIRANSVSPGDTYFEGGVWDKIKADDPKIYEASIASCPLG
ncbi:MAG: SDR family NAD(P)-dependent oxidoreductase, partial [Burkholderiales bacterium]|nr:SDR family NAD(P)-dependent oxidoreductase [Burkholderiales bacterium]